MKIKPIGDHTMSSLSGGGVSTDEVATNAVHKTGQKDSVAYINYAPIWGMFNGEYYKILVIIGGRGIGKTFGLWDYIAAQYKLGKWTNTRRFIWMRSTENAIKKLSQNNGQKLCDIGVQYKHNIKVYTVGINIYIRDMPEDGHIPIDDEWEKWKKDHPGTHVGYLMPVSTFYNDKGTAWTDVKMTFFDEVNREQGERNTFDLRYAFTQQVESIARTRQDIRMVLLGNTINDASDILSALNFIPREYGTFKLRGKRTIVMNIEDSDKFRAMREESLSYIFSGGGKGMPTLTNTLKNEELFSPKVQYISKFPGAIFMYRMYFTREDYFDIYSIKTGYWIGVTKQDPNIKRIYSFNPDLNGVVPYRKDLVINLKNAYNRKDITYQSEAVAYKFKTAMKIVTTFR